MIRRTQAPAIIAGALVGAISVLLFVSQPSYLLSLELRTEDRLISAIDNGSPSPHVAIVELDEASVAGHGRWPWPRDRLATLVRRLFDAGASVVALDFMFPEPDSAASTVDPGKTNDQVLAESFAGHPLVIGYHFGFEPAKPSGNCVLQPVPLSATRLNLHQATQVLCSLPSIASAAAGSGFLNASPDVDGVLRRVPLLIWYRGRIYPSLSLSAFLASGSSLVNVSSDPSDLILNHGPVPIDNRGGFRIRFRNPGSTFARISAAKVMEGQFDRDAVLHKILFVGVTARGLQDTVVTPTDGNMSGVEVQASALDNLLQRDSLRDSGPSRSLELVLILIGWSASLIILTMVRSLWAMPLLLALVTSGWLLCWGFLAGLGILVSPIIYTLAIGTNFALVSLLHFTVEKRRADRSDRKLAGSHDFMLHALAALAQTRDDETGAHMLRTQEYTRLLCDELRKHPKFASFLTPETVRLIVQLAPLHDIGKVGVPDNILKKPGPLTPEEYTVIQRHVSYGYEVLEKARIRSGVEDEALHRIARDIVQAHHERWDGKGYPDGLKADLIPVPGRIIAIVDMYDALVSKRVYKERITHEEAVQLIKAARGERFDPDIVDAFLRTQDHWRKVAIDQSDDEDVADS